MQELIDKSVEVLVGKISDPSHEVNTFLGSHKEKVQRVIDKAEEILREENKKEDGYLTLGIDDITNWRKYRAYAQWPRTSFEAERNGTRFRVIIVSAHFENNVFVLDTVKPAGKNEMTYQSFLQSGAKIV